jgi:hypothetical protein
MNARKRLSILIITGLYLFAAADTSFAERIIYVDADAPGANDGSSWEDAHKYLQDALADANSSPMPVQIRVAQGIYKPDQGAGITLGDRTRAFQLINGVTMKGGYAGFGAPEPNARNIALYETVLSGDIRRASDTSDNCYHVFYHPKGLNLDATAILDGFTITGGNARSSWPHDCGGGMFNEENSNPTLTNCTFSGNSANRYGGGMYNYKSSPTVTNCTFSGNSAAYGGGMYNVDNNSPKVEDCIFTNNSANRGGGMHNYNSSPTVKGCTFSGNSAGYGGGVSNEDSSPTMTNCTFNRNSSEQKGGGMYNDGSSPTVKVCTFTANSTNHGGGMYNYNSSPTVKGCTFNANLADYTGGGVYNYGSSPTLTNCIFRSNSALYGGGGMYDYRSSPTVNNCTFTGNSAEFFGGGMSNRYDSPATVTNCIFWGDVAPEISGTASITYSDIQGGWLGQGNIDIDPRFVDAGGSDYHLLPDSACINTGDPNYVAGPNDVDMDGEGRVMLGRVDMGADEFNPFAAEFVVVRKERVERTIFEYECEVVLENISRFAVRNVSLEMAKASANMTIIDSEVSFSDSDIPPGASARSVDTCTFTVDRAEAIDPAGIIWRVTAELADTGAKTEHTLTSMPPVGPPETGFEYLARLAEQWLWVGAPAGVEEDTIPDGTVNLADFARFADNWKTNP